MKSKITVYLRKQIILLIVLISGIVYSQCSVDYFGFFGDSPANTPNASVTAGVTGVAASSMTGGAGITLNNVNEAGSTGSSTVFQMVNLGSADFATAVASNHYMYTTITVPANNNIIRLQSLRMKNIGGTGVGRGAASFGVQAFDVAAGTSTTIFQGVAIANAATVSGTATTNFDMLPGKSYQVRIFVYNLIGGANLTTRSYDNPVLAFNVLPVLSGTTGTVCQETAFNLNSLVTNTNVSTANTTLQWYIDSGLTTLVNSPGAVGAGTYYPSYRDNTNTCNNPSTGPVTITTTTLGCPDFDGDGLANTLDLDDDNDGILDISEECIGFRAQNSTGIWNGDTVSNLTTVYTGTSSQVNVQNLSDSQINYYINQNGGQQRVAKSDNVNFSFSFSTPVKASEIAFYIEDLDPSIAFGSPAAQFTFLVNGAASASFVSMTLGGASPYLVYNSATGSVSLSSSSNDHRILLKGLGGQLVSSITLTSTGIGTGDAVAYSLFAKKTCDTDSDGSPNYLDFDSDGDGCADALEGSESVRYNQVYPLTFATVSLRGQIKVLADGTTSGTPSQVISTVAGANGVPLLVNNAANNTGGVAGIADNTDSSADAGQGIGTSQNSGTKDVECDRCFRPATSAGTGGLPTNHGITALSRAGDNGNWPMKITGAYTVLDAKTKGFVITRLTTAQLSTITNPVVGMMVYDSTANCLKIYDDTNAWRCFSTQTCDNFNQ